MTLVGESDWAGRDRRLGADGALRSGPRSSSPNPTACRTRARKRSTRSTRRESKATGGAALFAIGGVHVPGGRDATHVKGSSPAATAAAIAALRERLAGSPPEHVVVAPEGDAGIRDAGCRLGGALGRPGPLRGRRHAAQGDRRGAATPPTHPGLRARPRPRRSPRRWCGRSPRSTTACGASPARTRSPTRSPWPATTTATSAGTSTTPATASSSPAPTRRSTPPRAAPLSASGTWGPLLLTDDADTLPGALHGYLLDVKPGYTTDPTRAFYNHVWVIGDQEAISVGQQAEIDSLAELAKIGGKEP